MNQGAISSPLTHALPQRVHPQWSRLQCRYASVVSYRLGRLIRYLQGCSRYLVNYRQRRAQGLPISSAGAESVVGYVIGQCMKRNGHMRWTREGANALLQVRCAVLNGQDIRNFKRWYPPDRRIVGAPTAIAAS